MKSQKDRPDTGAEPGVESDALRLSDISGRDSAEIDEVPEEEPLGYDEDGYVYDGRGGLRPVFMAVAVVGLAAAAVIGAKIVRDRRRSNHGYRKALGHLEDAKDALVSAASELPERSRDVLQRISHH
jgi:hypothetical protein